MKWAPPIWLTIPGARRYAVSDRGEVRNSQGLLKPQLNDEGYRKLKLIGDDGKRRDHFVHRLVALAHLPPPRPQAGERYVLHGDANRENNSVGNLRWGTHEDNHKDKVAAGNLRPVMRKLRRCDVLRIRRSKQPARKLARAKGLSISHIREIRSGRKWSSITQV